MSDIWIRKMKTFFKRFDFDNDGMVHRKDFQLMAESFADLEKFDPVQKKIARERMDELFTLYTKASGTKDDALLTEDVMIESMKMQRDDPAMKKAIRDAMLSLFTAMDINHDGFLDFQEYRRAFENAGIVDSEFTKEAFATIDVNNDGKLSLEEFINATNDYMCSDDENTTAVFGLLF